MEKAQDHTLVLVATVDAKNHRQLQVIFDQDFKPATVNSLFQTEESDTKAALDDLLSQTLGRICEAATCQERS